MFFSSGFQVIGAASASSRFPWPAPASILCALCLCALLGLLGCAGEGEGRLFVYDGRSESVLVWDDLDKLHKAAEEGKDMPEPARRIQSTLLDGFTLAWGGMALDHRTNRLYLVSEDGQVRVITQADSRDGVVRKPDILSFSLGESSDRFRSGSVFGQAAMDSGHDTLYVMENAGDGSEARVWHVAKASTIRHQSTLEPKDCTFQAKGDGEGIGLAANPQGKFYGLFGKGAAFEDNDGGRGPRLREGLLQGEKASFHKNESHNMGMKVLAGSRTQLASPLLYGSLAFDGAHHELYVLPQPARSWGQAQILVFGEGQFTGDINRAPNRILSDTPGSLRIIAHPPTRDWLAGALFTPAAGPERAEQPRHPGHPDEVPDAAPAPGSPGGQDDEPSEPAAERHGEGGRTGGKGGRTGGEGGRTRGTGGQSQAEGNVGRGHNRGRGPGQSCLILWKGPSEGKPPIELRPLPGTKEIRGIALGD